MFFDLKFYSYSKPGRYLVAHLPCVASKLIHDAFNYVDQIDCYDVVIASVVIDRQKELLCEEAIEILSEQLP